MDKMQSFPHALAEMIGECFEDLGSWMRERIRSAGERLVRYQAKEARRVFEDLKAAQVERAEVMRSRCVTWAASAPGSKTKARAYARYQRASKAFDEGEKELNRARDAMRALELQQEEIPKR